MRTVLIGALVLAIASGACSSGSPTSSSTTTTTTTTTTATEATITDTFNGTVPVGGTIYFAFDITAYGFASVTFSSISGAGVSSGTQMRVSLGIINDDTCVTSTSIGLVTPGTTAQVTSTLEAGSYCVSITDVGNLFAPADVALSVLHP